MCIHQEGVTVTNELSNLKCAKAIPSAKPYSLFDGGGLHLRVTPVGGKLWRWAYRFEGKMKQMTFGKYPDVPLADARAHHAQARQLLAKGIDPMALRKEAKEQKKAKEVPVVEEPKGLTFEALTWKFFAWWKADKKADYVDDVESRLKRDIIPKVGNRIPGDVKRMEWVSVIQAIDERGARDLARRALHNVNQIYEFGMDNGLLDQNGVNPVAGIRPDKILSKVVEEHFASLPIGEVPVLLRKMRDYDGSALTRIALELLSLTFLRTSELIEGLWPEIEWKDKLWRLPKERMKGRAGLKKPHIVPLSTQSIALLDRLRVITGNSGRLFPSATDANGFMSNNTILKALDRMGYKGRMTGHGWRSIASTYLHEKGFDHEHIELQLAHSKEDKVSGAYNYAKYLEPRTKMMQAWADALDELREREVRRLVVSGA
jgi:integrase